MTSDENLLSDNKDQVIDEDVSFSSLVTRHPPLYFDRTYRRLVAKDLRSFQVHVQETDLYISAPQVLDHEAERLVHLARSELEDYIRLDPLFRTTFVPHAIRDDAPPIVCQMADAARAAGVGPMAAVAGALAEYVGQALLNSCSEVIVENGGDIFLKILRERTVAIFAGSSILSLKTGLRLAPEMTPLGICTSSGTVGPSFSFGRADAVTILAKSTALADAAATAVGNLVSTREELGEGLKRAQEIPGVLGVVLIKDDQLGAWGQVELVTLG